MWYQGVPTMAIRSGRSLMPRSRARGLSLEMPSMRRPFYAPGGRAAEPTGARSLRSATTFCTKVGKAADPGWPTDGAASGRTVRRREWISRRFDQVNTFGQTGHPGLPALDLDGEVRAAEPEVLHDHVAEA